MVLAALACEGAFALVHAAKSLPLDMSLIQAAFPGFPATAFELALGTPAVSVRASWLT